MARRDVILDPLPVRCNEVIQAVLFSNKLVKVTTQMKFYTSFRPVQQNLVLTAAHLGQCLRSIEGHRQAVPAFKHMLGKDGFSLFRCSRKCTQVQTGAYRTGIVRGVSDSGFLLGDHKDEGAFTSPFADARARV
jgi:hypothetical protein